LQLAIAGRDGQIAGLQVALRAQATVATTDALPLGTTSGEVPQTPPWPTPDEADGLEPDPSPDGTLAGLAPDGEHELGENGAAKTGKSARRTRTPEEPDTAELPGLGFSSPEASADPGLSA